MFSIFVEKLCNKTKETSYMHMELLSLTYLCFIFASSHSVTFMIWLRSTYTQNIIQFGSPDDTVLFHFSFLYTSIRTDHLVHVCLFHPHLYP